VAAYDIADHVMAYVSYRPHGKSGGINMSGLPLNAQNLPALNTVVIKPRRTRPGKSRQVDPPGQPLRLNADLFSTTIHDFQTNVVDTGRAPCASYLGQLPGARSGREADSDLLLDEHCRLTPRATFIDAQYVSYVSVPARWSVSARPPRSAICRPTSSGAPKWAWSAGGEYKHSAAIGATQGEAYLHAEAAYRGNMYGDPTDPLHPAAGLHIANAALGFRAKRPGKPSSGPRTCSIRTTCRTSRPGRQTPARVGTPGDPGTYGVTLKRGSDLLGTPMWSLN